MIKSFIVCLAGSCSFVLLADELHDHMEKVGKANGALRKAVGAGDMKVISENATVMVDVLPATIPVWEKHKFADAVKWTSEGVVAAKELKAAADANNADAVRTAMGKLGASCKSCHTAHREEIPETNPKKYRIK